LRVAYRNARRDKNDGKQDLECIHNSLLLHRNNRATI